MELLFLCILIFLFLLAIFDLSVGVSNDAVNFLNSAVGSGAATFRRVIIIASIGVFIGAAMSNGMMDIARHGIFRPEHFSFYDIICIFMAVMVTDIILLDIFNTLGMPTSTTVSMVFELLGATFVVALIKMYDGAEADLGDLLNTGKALTVIMGIFLSVAIAFVFGTVVQFLARTIFTFNYRSRLKWKIGIFGGICATAIVYFMLLKGTKDMSFMTADVKAWIAAHTWQILAGSLLFFTVLMQLLHMAKVNVLKVIVLMGTFSLAMAFAGNDLVNFIGVPLTGLSAYQDYMANGMGDARGFTMNSLNSHADTPVWFLVGAGIIMVISLARSKKARNVARTEIGLGSQNAGEEMFGSSRIARRLVRWVLSAWSRLEAVTPPKVKGWLGRRFDSSTMITENQASFDLIRGSVNLVLAGILIALGTSMKLPLSTTFVTFMVAMGTSLADRAWGRESAVFRITGVISVIGGWFLTAGVAFIGAGVIVFLMHVGGHWAMIALGVATVFIIIRSNRRFGKKAERDSGDEIFDSIISAKDGIVEWNVLQQYVSGHQQYFMSYARGMYAGVTEAFIKDDARTLSRADGDLARHKQFRKNARRKETLCLRRVEPATAIEKSAWFHLSNNCCMSILYNLRRIDEVCKEHVENNFRPLPEHLHSQFEGLRGDVDGLYADVLGVLDTQALDRVTPVRRRCDAIKDSISDINHRLHHELQEGDAKAMAVTYVYINILQETQEMVSALRKYMRAYAKMCDSNYSGHKRS